MGITSIVSKIHSTNAFRVGLKPLPLRERFLYRTFSKYLKRESQNIDHNFHSTMPFRFENRKSHFAILLSLHERFVYREFSKTIFLTWFLTALLFRFRHFQGKGEQQTFWVVGHNIGTDSQTPVHSVPPTLNVCDSPNVESRDETGDTCDSSSSKQPRTKRKKSQDNKNGVSPPVDKLRSHRKHSSPIRKLFAGDKKAKPPETKITIVPEESPLLPQLPTSVIS